MNRLVRYEDELMVGNTTLYCTTPVVKGPEETAKLLSIKLDGDLILGSKRNKRKIVLENLSNKMQAIKTKTMSIFSVTFPLYHGT